MDVSVIIPVRKDPSIGACLEAVLAQARAPSFEVLVVENDETQQLRPLIAEYPVAYACEPAVGSYRARNRGIRAAQGDVLAFTDADCVPGANWLAELAGGFTADDVGGVAGGIDKHPGDTPVEKAQREFLLRDGLQRLPPIFPAPFAPAGNVAYRRDVVARLGGFDEAFVSGGDVDFSWRVHLAGYRLVYNRRARVTVRCRTSVWGYFRQYYKYGLGHVLLFRKHRRHTGKRVLFNPYPFKGMAVATGALLTAGLFRLLVRRDASYALGRVLDVTEHVALLCSALVGSLRYGVVYV